MKVRNTSKMCQSHQKVQSERNTRPGRKNFPQSFPPCVICSGTESVRHVFICEPADHFTCKRLTTLAHATRLNRKSPTCIRRYPHQRYPMIQLIVAVSVSADFRGPGACPEACATGCCWPFVCWPFRAVGRRRNNTDTDIKCQIYSSTCLL